MVDLTKPVAMCTLGDLAEAIIQLTQKQDTKQIGKVLKGYSQLAVYLQCSPKKVSKIHRQGGFKTSCIEAGTRTKYFDPDKALEEYTSYIKNYGISD